MIMDNDVYKRMGVIDAIAKGDDEYSDMLKELRILETRYFTVLDSLSVEQQNIICDFVSQCEGMSFRKLELACTYMRFPG